MWLPTMNASRDIEFSIDEDSLGHVPSPLAFALSCVFSRLSKSYYPTVEKDWMRTDGFPGLNSSSAIAVVNYKSVEHFNGLRGACRPRKTPPVA